MYQRKDNGYDYRIRIMFSGVISKAEKEKLLPRMQFNIWEL